MITLIALGPMTNLALACRLDEEFAHNLKELIWMGGTIYGKGNHTYCAEFNVAADPEAAHAVYIDSVWGFRRVFI
jgi:inosine-uridine nucleoside N-ribohydrolase